jgi:hypothetical protein
MAACLAAGNHDHLIGMLGVLTHPDGISGMVMPRGAGFGDGLGTYGAHLHGPWFSNGDFCPQHPLSARWLLLSGRFPRSLLLPAPGHWRCEAVRGAGGSRFRLSTWRKAGALSRRGDSCPAGRPPIAEQGRHIGHPSLDQSLSLIRQMLLDFPISGLREDLSQQRKPRICPRSRWEQRQISA